MNPDQSLRKWRLERIAAGAQKRKIRKCRTNHARLARVFHTDGREECGDCHQLLKPL